MKKIFALILAMIMVFSLSACGGGTAASNSPAPAPASSAPAPAAPAPSPAAPAPSPAAPAPAPAPAELNVAVFYYNFADVYISSVRGHVDKALGDLGVKFNNYDGAGNQTTQTEQISTAITNGANLLIVNIVENSSDDAAQNAADAAKAAGIPIVFFNRDFGAGVINSYADSAFVGTDAPEAGHMQGELIAETLLAAFDDYDLNGDGTISYVMFKGQEGNVEAEYRTQFAVEDADKALTGAGKSALAFYDANNASKYLVDQGGNWSAAAATEYMDTILAEYNEANGNMIEMVIANNDDMAAGAVSSLQTAGYNTGEADVKVIPVFGVDAVDNAKALINEGKMTGTIMQDAKGMADTICALVANVKAEKALMDGINAAGGYNVDGDAAKIRVPYGKYIG